MVRSRSLRNLGGREGQQCSNACNHPLNTSFEPHHHHCRQQHPSRHIKVQGSPPSPTSPLAHANSHTLLSTNPLSCDMNSKHARQHQHVVVCCLHPSPTQPPPTPACCYCWCVSPTCPWGPVLPGRGRVHWGWAQRSCQLHHGTSESGHHCRMVRAATAAHNTKAAVEARKTHTRLILAR